MYCNCRTTSNYAREKRKVDTSTDVVSESLDGSNIDSQAFIEMNEDEPTSFNVYYKEGDDNSTEQGDETSEVCLNKIIYFLWFLVFT